MLGKKVLPFQEEDGQDYQLVSDEGNSGVSPGKPWKKWAGSEDKAIYGLGPIEITVSYFEDFKQLLKNVYGMRTIMNEEDVALLEVGEGGNGGQVILERIQRDQLPYKDMAKFIMYHLE